VHPAPAVQGVCSAASLGIAPKQYKPAPLSAAPQHKQSIKTERNANYNAIDNKGPSNPKKSVRVRMPYMGMLLLQQALDGGAEILARDAVGECKAYVLRTPATGALRVLVLNKVQNKDCAVDVRMTPEQAARYATNAHVDYLYAGKGLYESWQLFLSGMVFENWGTKAVQGDGNNLNATAYKQPGGAGFAVAMKPGTKAMLITIPRKQ